MAGFARIYNLSQLTPAGVPAFARWVIANVPVGDYVIAPSAPAPQTVFIFGQTPLTAVTNADSQFILNKI